VLAFHLRVAALTRLQGGQKPAGVVAIGPPRTPPKSFWRSSGLAGSAVEHVCAGVDHDRISGRQGNFRRQIDEGELKLRPFS
jgi:hypothetical protein